jgi:hypothetical protein
MAALNRAERQLAQVRSMVYGHQRFVRRNTGLTEDAHVQHFIQNPDGVLSNNRHFIADTMAEYQPNGDGTTEGQALHVIGYALMYMATKDQQFLDAAVHAWEAYINFFYAGQTLPTTPQRYICNWLVNSKEPVLANYPINPIEPTQGGYKCVPLVFTNGLARIPHGAPFWGEYLDVATYAHRGHMTWNSINASVQKIQENVNGAIDWQTVYDNFRRVGPEPWLPGAWIDWPAYLGVPSYTVQWGGSAAKEVEYPVSWITTWAGTKIGIGKGPDDQLWSGDILEEGIPVADRGVVQLEDETINGVYLFNFAVKLPVEHGGYMFARNEPWHNRPVHTPFLGSVNQLGNAADAEVWFIDASYLLWRITGQERFKHALDCAFFTAHEYTYIDATDKYFRQSKAANTPFTDGISYDFSYPELTAIEYGRDADGYITIKADRSSQHFLEQQSVWFRIGPDSKLRITYGGVGDSGAVLGCKVMLDVSPTKEETQNPTWYGLALPKSESMTPIQRDVPVTSLARMTNPGTGEDYLVADARAVTDYGGCTWAESFENDVHDGRSATVINAFFPNDDAGFIIGFWLTGPEVVFPKSITYRSDSDFNMRLLDADSWRWWWMLPATGGVWRTVTFKPEDATLSGYQPDHPDDPEPSAPNLVAVDQITILLDTNTPNSTFSYYVVNDVPPLMVADGWTMTYRMALNSIEPWSGVVGDCKIVDYRLDSLAYCPGVIPFSNIYSEGSEQIGAWHGMPYPGYQYPLMYTLHRDNSKYSLWLQNQVDFMRDSQMAYEAQVGEMGPGCAAYIWNRWDNYKYGKPDTWTTFHWGDGKPWAGYQPRAYQAAARAWYELAMRGEPVPPKLSAYVETWIGYLVQFSREFGGHTPNEFPTAPNRPVWVPDDPTAHMIGLWLAGSCYAALAGSTVPGLDDLIEVCVAELTEAYTVTSIPGKPINGAYSPAARESSDNGMAFGFYTGEVFRGLALYMLLRSRGAGFDMYSATAIPNHAAASISQ